MNKEEEKATQIAFNFGPIRGNVEKQIIYPAQPSQRNEQPSEEVEPKDPASTEKPANNDQLTISQAVILLSSLLGEPLEQGYGKQKTKLADLISKVTGYKASSVRQKIMEIGKMRNYPHNIQQDAEMVAKIIETYNSQVASDIRITYLDE